MVDQLLRLSCFTHTHTHTYIHIYIYIWLLEKKKMLDTKQTELSKAKGTVMDRLTLNKIWS
jgi:hypothetical protein